VLTRRGPPERQERQELRRAAGSCSLTQAEFRGSVLSTQVEKPLISVIIACYNQERFVAEAIDGILSQTYRPLEVVIVDDCSPDRTAEIIQAKLAEHPSRSDIRFVRNQENMTARGVCKIGFSQTKGDFVMIGCGDDIWLPDMIAEFAQIWTEEKVSYVVANASYIDDNSKPLNRTFRDPAVRADDSFETLARDGVNACCFGPAVGLERELYATFGWPPAYLGAVDIMLPFYAYLLKGARFIEKPLLKYRVHARNTSLSLMAEQSGGVERLTVLERTFFGHVAHALFMQDELARVTAQMPDRYSELEKRISPLLTIQTVEMARKLVRTRVELEEVRRRASNPG
jgi:hypothetical protein